MKLPLQITFRNMEKSTAMEADVRVKAEKLDEFCAEIMSCRVMVESHHRHHHEGNQYHVRIDLTVPGAELVARREPSAHHAYTDVYVAIRDAFDNMRRQLEDYARRRRGEVKHHQEPSHGHISEINREQGYGRIATSDNREIYFHSHSVINAKFAQLDVGVEVSYAEEQGEQGPQASTVRVVGKHHYVS